MNPSEILRPPIRCSLACALGVLSGCAVMTVDVDVYKGPLANQEHVQTEQLAVMAMGAKPLLVALRDRFESGLCNITQKSWYQSEYIPPDDDGASRFEKPEADRVNDILYLYEDRQGKESSELLLRATKALEKYRAAYGILRPTDLRGDKELWDRVEKSAEKAASWFERDREKSAGKLLFDAYRDFLTKDWRDAKGLLSAAFNYQEAPQGKEFKILEKSRIPELTASSNAAFRFILESDLVAFHAKNVFKLNERDASRFTGRVKEIARSFFDAMSALEECWYLILDGFIEINDPSITKMAEPKLGKLNKEFASALVNIIQPQHLVALHEITQATDNEGSVIPLRLRKSIESSNATGRETPGVNLDLIKDELFKTIVEKPLETAKSLKRMHEYSKSSLKESDLARISRPLRKESLGFLAGWQFGLIRGPSRDKEENVDPVEPVALFGYIQKTVGAIGGVLAKGRLDLGIETLIERYLKAVYDSCGQESDSVRCEREKLLNELIHFAEKLIFLANNEGFISPPSGGGGILGIFHNFLFRNIIEVIPGYFTDIFKRDIFNEGRDGYIQVLQAIGNSILLQVNELHHRDDQRSLLAAGKQAEVSAILQWYKRDPVKILDDLLDGLRAEKKEKQEKKTPNLARTEKPGAGPGSKRDSSKERGLIGELGSWLKEKIERWIRVAWKARGGLEVALKGRNVPDATREAQDGDLKSYDDAIEVVEGLKSQVVAEAQKHDEECSPELVFRILLARIRKKLESEAPPTPEKIKLEHAIAVLEKSVPLMTPPDIREALRSEKIASSKDVLDLLIAALRQQHIQAVRQFGKDSEQEKRIAAAIAAAYEHRSGMIYIRPPSAYLRTSYPSTSLQSDPNIEWRNMLFGHSLRSIPFAMQLRNLLFPWKKREALLQAEIDKQFWQNINRVRVAGAGNTNYVIAKDDIGNWYVKSYSANPEDIIRSAKNLAMFSLGPGAAAGALQNIAARDSTTLVKGEASKSSPSWRQRRFETFRKKFNEATVDTYTELKKSAGGLKKSILDRWEAEPKTKKDFPDYQKVLEEAATRLQIKEPSDPEKDPKFGQVIIDQLRAIQDFRERLLKALKDRQDARDIADDILRKALERFSDRRRAEIDEYESALTVLGGSEEP